MKNTELSATTLKIIAITAMTIDHTALVFFASDTALWYYMRIIGRITAPIMSFLIAEGFHYTRSKSKYLLRMTAFAIISQPMYYLMIFRKLPANISEYLMNQSVMYTFSMSLIILLIAENKKINKYIKVLLISVCFGFSCFGDWGYIIPAWVLVFHLFRGSIKRRAFAFGISSILLITYGFVSANYDFTGFWYQYGVLLALIPLTFYSGKRGGNGSAFISKWGFYVYYPLHMAVLIVLKYSLYKL